MVIGDDNGDNEKCPTKKKNDGKKHNTHQMTKKEKNN